MCGIAGVLEFDAGSRPSSEGLARMGSVLHHRGPDDIGVYENGAVGLVHRRLSIIDLASGQQPMKSQDGQVCVVFNGEIYNYLELKESLERDGYEFKTRSDTEVLLALYLKHGIEAFAKINGMFACAFWDRRNDRLVLGRDRLGKKPMFYYQDRRRFLFGSEIKALLAHGGIERKVNPAALHEYLTHTYVVGENSILEGVKRLPAASVLILQNGQVTIRAYWRLHFDPRAQGPEEEVIDRMGMLLREAVKRRLMSDVPLGAFLSGGLDSSVIVALMAEQSTRPVRTFTIGFEESDYSELEDARVVAKHLGTDHHELIIKPAGLKILPELVWFLDEPFGDSSAVPTFYVCQAARQHVTVALSGDGGDELFAGYMRYQRMNRYQRMALIPPWVRRGLVRPITSLLPFTTPGWNYLYALGNITDGGPASGCGIYPYIQGQLYTGEFLNQLQGSNPFEAARRILAQVSHLDPVSQYQYLDTLQYLPADILTKVDRMSMANSLEVRSPLLDYTLVEYMATLPLSFKLHEGVSKYILRKFCAGILPPSVLTKKKQGFALPKDQWFQKDLSTYAQEVLLDHKTLARGYFRKATVERLLQHHMTGRRDYSAWIWCLIVLELWFRSFLDEQQPYRDVGGTNH